LFNGEGHTRAQMEVRDLLQAHGYDVLWEPQMRDADGTPFRGDLMYMRNNEGPCGDCTTPESRSMVDQVFGNFGVVDVKTPEGPDFTKNQETGYPDFNNGRATSYTKSTWMFGYPNGATLPAGKFVLWAPKTQDMPGVLFWAPNTMTRDTLKTKPQ